ncbi:uncharacterized protein CXorf38 [Hippoglossus stenolepis]|uniref:uncharacterized protein CXorf38 n=1 Tax=Hippoglossus stenolepis TaxID=195615 RepID=UPI001FAF8DE6|nr:uncharacterized protein CXorf38 [Hippoglossus stenolepis]
MVSEELLLRLNDSEYKNWLKAGRCLLILKSGLHPFTSQHMRCFHKDLLTHSPLLGRPCETNACRGNKLSWACRACSEWKTAILAHQRQPNRTVHWENCSPPSWRTDFWEVAKAYMPGGQGKVKGADQCDASALLNLINSCDCFQTVDPKFVREVIQYRNELMHSCELRIKDEWIRRYQKTLKHFVRQFSHVPQMAKVGQEIDEMLTVDLSLSVSGLDQLDSVDSDGLVCDSEATVDLISQWEAELLQEKLQELLHTDNEDADTRDTEQLKMLGGFLQANRDLGERFSAELQAIDSLQARK